MKHPSTCSTRNIMNPINAILKKNPAILSLFVIAPDETVAHCHSNTLHPPPCPANHLNHFYHSAVGLLPGSGEIRIFLGATCLTLRSLPQNWVLAIHHQPKCSPSPLDALQKATESLPKSAKALKEEALTILTPDAVMDGELGRWVTPLKKYFADAIGEPSQPCFNTAINAWIDMADPCTRGLHQLSALLAEAIPSPEKRDRYTQKAKEILATVERTNKGGRHP